MEFWSHPNPNGSFNGEPERAKMAAKPPFFASRFEVLEIRHETIMEDLRFTQNCFGIWKKFLEIRPCDLATFWPLQPS